VHLTNVSIQKHGEDYNETNGGKWPFQNLLLYLNASYGREATAKLNNQIDSILIHSLKSVQVILKKFKERIL
jgi:tubulin polyglutamylase TTLL1